jgi:hypothetical protein
MTMFVLPILLLAFLLFTVAVVVAAATHPEPQRVARRRCDE